MDNHRIRLLPASCALLMLAFVLTWSTSVYAQEPQRNVNAPYTTAQDDIPITEQAIFWFGHVGPTSNYADVRVIYNDENLYVTVSSFDRQLWYDDKPTVSSLTEWDAVSLYVNSDGAIGDTPATTSYRFDAQLHHSGSRSGYEAAYQGNNASWTSAAVPFSTNAGWRGGGINDSSANARGWWVSYTIPFESLGLSGPPHDALWGLAIALHDRDDESGTPLPLQTWPETLDPSRPASWGTLHFGRSNYSPPFVSQQQTITIRHGVDGGTIIDGEVGGHSTCGEQAFPSFFSQWGDLNYAGYHQINIQNQWDVADWPCFSKFYVMVPLDSVPANKFIASASLTLNIFGNAGVGYTPAPQRSLIQAFTIDASWNEQTLTWNNAPLAVENISATWVDPITSYEWPGAPIAWDVTEAVAEAYQAGEPLRVALYSADAGNNSGKYFFSSDAGEEARPTLQVQFGNPATPTDYVYIPLIVGPE